MQSVASEVQSAVGEALTKQDRFIAVRSRKSLVSRVIKKGMS